MKVTETVLPDIDNGIDVEFGQDNLSSSSKEAFREQESVYYRR